MTNGKSNPALARFAQFERHKGIYGYLALATIFFIHAAINASSAWMEHSRSNEHSLLLWEPVLWESSSAISTLLLCPLLFWWFRQHPPRWYSPGRQLLQHFLVSLAFSLAHIALMVGIRELGYNLAGQSYHFGPLLREFLYEYRKDAWTYLFLFGCYHLGSFVYSRLKGEANVLDSAGDPQSPTVLEHFLVKKLDKEFLIKVGDIDWLEASGNYVNLHSNGRIYPLRATLNGTLQQLHGQGFSRIHRRFAVNHKAIDNISYQTSGDGEILLKNGQRLALSRRYKEAFRNALQK